MNVNAVDLSFPEKGIAVVRMQEPPVNAWTDRLFHQFEQILEGQMLDRARVVVLTGHGKAFNAGGDFNRFRQITDQAGARDFVLRAQSVMDRVVAIPCPVIAAINGIALGGGLELAMACDIRVAGRSAKLGQPETRWGILAGAGGTQRLTRLIGPGRAKLMMFTAEPVTAAQALSYGLVDLVTDGDDPFDECMQIARRIAKVSPVANRSVKRCVDAGGQLHLDAGLKLERDLWVNLVAQGSLREGADAFFERRDPVYPDP